MSGATLTVNGTGILQIGGLVDNQGTFDVRSGTLDFNGTTTQSIAGSMFFTKTLNNLTASNPAGLNVSNTAGDSLKVTGVLSFGASSVTLNTGDNVVLVSNASGTARVADITNGGSNTSNSFSGKVIVQRYYPALRAWRLNTAPVANTGNIFTNWQNSGVYPPTAVGMLVTGPVVTAANGLDPSYENNPSMKYWSVASQALVSVTDTKNTLLSNNGSTAANIGFFSFVRGDRNPNNTIVPNTNVTTLSAKGNLQTGDQPFPASTTSGAFTLIGNPYMSPVDFNKITRNNVIKRFYAWDPRLNLVGGYVVLEDLNNNGVYTITPASPGGQNNIIQSSQAIYVQTDNLGGTTSLVFKEGDKATVSNGGMFRPVTTHNKIKINLNKLNADNSLKLADGAQAEFDDSYSKNVDLQDALKFGNINEVVGLYRKNTLLAVERRPIITADDTLYIRMTKTTQRKYILDIETDNLNQNSIAGFIEDGFLKTSTPIDLNGTNKIDFEVNSTSASAAPDRFRIVFKQMAPLPVTFKNIKAYPQGDNIMVDWTVENELNIVKYEVEKSIDGVSFVKVNTTAATNSNGATNNYKWLDQNAVNGNNYYRVKSTGADGKTNYTTIVVVKISRGPGGMRVYPNPVTTGIIDLEFKHMPGGIYKAILMNSLGQSILIKTINHAGGTTMQHIKPDYRLPSGIYQLEITAPDKTMTKVKVIIK